MSQEDEHPAVPQRERIMNISTTETSGALTQHASIRETLAAKEATQRNKDLPRAQQVEASHPTDRVELSVASKVLAVLSEQADDGAELQLPPDKLRELAHG